MVDRHGKMVDTQSQMVDRRRPKRYYDPTYLKRVDGVIPPKIRNVCGPLLCVLYCQRGGGGLFFLLIVSPVSACLRGLT